MTQEVTPSEHPSGTSSQTDQNSRDGRWVPVRKIGGWWNNYYAAILAIIAIGGSVPGGVAYFRQHFTSSSLQQIVDQAEGWTTTYSANFGPGFKRDNWSAYYAKMPPYGLSVDDDTLYLSVQATQQGGWNFMEDEEPGAMLRPGDFYLSSDVSQPSGCEYGLAFNIDYSDRYGWIYIDHVDNKAFYGLEVSTGKPGAALLHAVPEKSFNEAIDTIGIVRYGSIYILTINGTAQTSVSAGSLEQLAHGSLAGPRIGIDTYTCPGRSAEYIYSNISVQIPYRTN